MPCGAFDIFIHKEQIRKADAELEKIGYLQNNAGNSSIVLIEFCLKDIPGSVTDILELINAFNFNISYINPQENGTDYQHFKMGLYVEDPGRTSCNSARSPAKEACGENGFREQNPLHRPYINICKILTQVVLIDYNNNIAFTGDVYINTHGLTAEQAEYNQYAPILMTSVDTDPKLCGQERNAILRRLGVGNWKIFGAHGSPKDYCVK